MAIRGALSEFSVPELLQLLSLQQKTGVLTLAHKQGHTHVLFFRKGRVMAAADRRQSGRHAFLSYLVENQLLALDQVESVEDIAKSTGHDLFTVLLTSGVVGRDRLAEQMHRYSQRLVDELVNWPDGDYEFSPTEERALPSHGLPLDLNPEELVLESMRRQDELSTMKESMLAPDLVLAPVETSASQPLPRECVVVLKLVDGVRAIDEIVRRSPLGEYLTYDAISELLGRQQVMIVDPHDKARLAMRRKANRKSAGPALVAMVSLILGSALLGTGLGPLLAKSRNQESWLESDLITRRSEVREQLRAQVAGLRESPPE